MLAREFSRLLYAAVLAGVVAGALLTFIQSRQVAPLILEAERYESAAVTGPGTAPAVHDHATHDHDARASDEPWAPDDGLERLAWTAMANIGTAIGFALLIGAVLAWRGRAGWRQGLVWGAAGFVVFFANPALGLHPELPGTLAADLQDRQLWWLLAVGCSAAGVGLLVLGKGWLARLGGVAALAVPHLLGAPHPEVAGSMAPAELTARFELATAVTNAVFWLVLGLATAVAYRRLAR